MNINDRTNSFDRTDIDQNKVISALAYLGPLFFPAACRMPEFKVRTFSRKSGADPFYMQYSLLHCFRRF